MIKKTKDITNIVADADGKRKGLSQKQAAQILKAAQVVVATDMLKSGTGKAMVLFHAGVTRQYNKLSKLNKK